MDLEEYYDGWDEAEAAAWAAWEEAADEDQPGAQWGTEPP